MPTPIPIGTKHFHTFFAITKTNQIAKFAQGMSTRFTKADLLSSQHLLFVQWVLPDSTDHIGENKLNASSGKSPSSHHRCIETRLLHSLLQAIRFCTAPLRLLRITATKGDTSSASATGYALSRRTTGSRSRVSICTCESLISVPVASELGDTGNSVGVTSSVLLAFVAVVVPELLLLFRCSHRCCGR